MKYIIIITITLIFLFAGMHGLNLIGTLLTIADDMANLLGILIMAVMLLYGYAYLKLIQWVNRKFNKPKTI